MKSKASYQFLVGVTALALTGLSYALKPSYEGVERGSRYAELAENQYGILVTQKLFTEECIPAHC